ncbi:MAG: HAD family hydrolase [Clostridiales bacterium]|nr:HAD family hydrolase [Clostridiales bacterium]
MKAFIFDMDGLMFDTERVFVSAWDYAGEKMGVGKAGYMCLKTLGMNTAACEQAWRDEFAEQVDTAALWAYSREYMDAYYSKYTVSAKKGLHDLLTYLRRKGYKLAVASSTKRATVEKHLLSAGVRGYFDAVITGDMVEKSKPEPDIYLRAAMELGVKPEECYALEDSRNGLLSAHAAGMKVIMVPDLWQPDDVVKQFILGPFESLLDVRDWLVARQ